MGFCFEFFDDTRILMLHDAAPPPVVEWRDYLTALAGKDVTKLGLLVFTAGGAPGPAQRRELNGVLAGRYFARAIVHRSAAVRGVLAAVGWFAPGVKGFAPDAWPAAARHVGFQPEELPQVANRVRRLHAENGRPVAWLEQALGRTGPER
jgi:hypothetical protein